MKAKFIKSEEIGEVLVDLTNENRGATSIGKQWNIELEPPTVKKVFQRFGLKIEKPILLALHDITTSRNLIYKKGTLLSVIFDGKEYPEGTTVETTLTALKTPFQIVLNTNALQDCKEKQEEPAKVYPVKFHLDLLDPTGNEGENVITTLPVQFGIVFREVNTVPQVKISMTRKSLEYDDSLREEEIGSLTIKNTSFKEYYPNVDCNLVFIVRNHVTGLACDNIYLKLNDSGMTHITIKNMGKSESYTFKIMANMPLINNPISQDCFVFDVVASVRYNHVGHRDTVYQLPDCEAQFTVKRNRTKPQLMVEAQWEGLNEWKYLQNDNTCIHDLPCVSYSLESAMSWPCFTLRISNKAMTGAPGVGIIVRNFRCIPFLGEYTEARFARKQTIEQVFKPTDEVSGLFRLEHSQNKEIIVAFNESDIKDVFTHNGTRRDYTSPIYFDITFDYWDENAPFEFSVLPEGMVKKFKTRLKVPVFQSASAQWLGIDYGTSAIVCRYGGVDLNLRDRKTELFNNEADNYEVGTPYLSSNVILRNNRDEADGHGASDLLRDFPADAPVPDFNKLAVTLSPTSSEEDRNIDYILPCLKMLLGYDKIPNVTQYRNFQYDLKDDYGNIITKQLYKTYDDGDIEYSELCDVDTILCEVYKELFAYYVKPEIRNILLMNNIVLTVPNTFAPNHFERLRKLVDDSFYGYNIRNLKFISESDAVACFYLSNWNEINCALNRNVESIRELEQVLVFDMGGGTLDITYLTREGVNDIFVKGRMGIAKAGNYLDGLLAGLIAKRVQQLKKVVEIEEINDTNRLIAARKLRDIIKNELKPKMAKHGETLLISRSDFGDIGVRQDFIINVDDIINDEEFKEYVESCTEDVLDRFLYFYDLYDENNDVCIDTVIISGRASKLPQIRKSLTDYLNDHKPDGNDVFCAIDMSTVLPSDKSKDVVVEGALAYASRDNLKVHTNNIMANYGVIYYDAFGATCYEELLNSRYDDPEETVESEDMTINVYKTDDVELDLSGCIGDKMLTLVQTYSDSDEALDDWEDGLNEYFTIMATYNIPAHLDRSKVRLHIEVNRQNQMRLYMNGGFCNALAPAFIDVDSELNKRSMWPMKYNN